MAPKRLRTPATKTASTKDKVAGERVEKKPTKSLAKITTSIKTKTTKAPSNVLPPGYVVATGEDAKKVPLLERDTILDPRMTRKRRAPAAFGKLNEGLQGKSMANHCRFVYRGPQTTSADSEGVYRSRNVQSSTSRYKSKALESKGDNEFDQCSRRDQDYTSGCKAKAYEGNGDLKIDPCNRKVEVPPSGCKIKVLKSNNNNHSENVDSKRQGQECLRTKED